MRTRRPTGPVVGREISRFPCKERPSMPGSQTTPGRPGARGNAPVRVAFRQANGVGVPGLKTFRGSMAGLPAPLSTLRPRPRGQRRMTRGQRGSLLLRCRGLSPPTPCRSPGALGSFCHFVRGLVPEPFRHGAPARPETTPRRTMGEGLSPVGSGRFHVAERSGEEAPPPAFVHYLFRAGAMVRSSSRSAR
jgi:hypothetical protein